jgi:hypothetical protein
METRIEKLCTKCNQICDIEEFAVRASNNRISSWCDNCHRKYRKEYYKQHITRYRALGKKWKLKHLYNITIEQYNQMLSAQQGKCAICFQPMIPPVLDHDHATGKVRELLCILCNMGIGAFQENGDILRLAIRYIEGHAYSNL